MLVTFLGTGTSQGVPVIACKCSVCLSASALDKRLRSSIQIELNGKTIVIDSGPDFRQQMLRNNTQQLDALLFTHEHKDHIAGLDDIRAFNYKQKKAIDIFATQRVQNALRREYQYIFDEIKYPGIPEVNFITIFANKTFLIDDIEVLPIEVLHYKLPVLGFRIKDFTYITDANFITDKNKEKIKGSKYLVLNALRNETHISHFTLKEAIKLSEELEIPNVYFTHISHQLGIHNDINATLPAGYQLAYDGLQLRI